MNTPRRTILGTVALCATAVAATSAARDDASAMAGFDWLAGHWCMERDGTHIEEHWLPARGGMLMSVGRTVAGGEVKSFEYLRLERRDGVVTFVAQPDGAPPTPFRLTDSGDDWARFENPLHDFPKRVEYRRVGKGLHAEISGPGADGRDRVIGFDYLPCPGG
jgi:hypothetical protein